MSQVKMYQQMILDHNTSPKNFGELPGATHQAEGYNPLCGDRYSVFLKISETDPAVVEDIRFKGEGCAISKASASMMTQILKGKTLEEAEKLFLMFKEMTMQEPTTEALKELGKLAVFSNIWKYPTRVKCANIAWHAFHNCTDSTHKAETI